MLKTKKKTVSKETVSKTKIKLGANLFFINRNLDFDHKVQELLTFLITELDITMNSY
jgi:hypothetical protein